MNIRLAKRRLGSFAAAIVFATIANSANSYTYHRLHNFDTNGYDPTGGPILSNGFLWGTTSSGGANSPAGTIYKYELSSGTYTKLYDFCSSTNCSDGSGPIGNLVVGSDGSLYGTTAGGGANLGGTIYRLSPNGSGWTELVLYDFDSPSTGASGFAPRAGLTYRGAASGSLYNGTAPLYGVTSQGGPNQSVNHDGGVVFKFKPSNPNIGSPSSYTILHAFADPMVTNDFEFSGSYGGWAGLTIDALGSLYGGADTGGDYVAGGLFKLTPSGNVFTYTKVLDLCASGTSRCPEGRGVEAAPTLDSSGDIYSSTYSGGTNGLGTAFVQTGIGQTVLYTFCSVGSSACTDGYEPALGSPLILDSSGNLFGTTAGGGAGADGGEVFELSGTSVPRTLTTLYSFCSNSMCKDGSGPIGNIWKDGSGNLYGVTQAGGVYNEGVLFELSNP